MNVWGIVCSVKSSLKTPIKSTADIFNLTTNKKANKYIPPYFEYLNLYKHQLNHQLFCLPVPIPIPRAASQSKVHMKPHQRLLPLHQHFLWTLDWPAVLGKPSKISKLSTGLFAILITLITMSDRNRRQIYSLLRYMQDKETEIGNTLGFVHQTYNFKISEKMQ